MSELQWLPEREPRAALLLIHGMCEHVRRYETFARALNAQGYAVLAEDLPGHGPECPTLGYCPGDMWALSQEAIRRNFARLRQRYPDLPIVVFGHSYGSFLLQSLVPTLGADAYILSGSARQTDPEKLKKLYDMACAMAPQEKANAIAELSFNAFNQSFAAEGRNAWLSRDRAQVERYNRDPLCGFVVSGSFYKGMYGGLIGLCDREFPPRPEKPVPILVMSGDRDPVGGFGEGVKELAELYSQRGYPVTLRLYAQARHETLNECNREEVTEDVLAFLNMVLP